MAKIEIKGTLRRYDVACRDVSATGLGIAIEPDVELDVGDVVETSIRLIHPDNAEDTKIWVVSEVRWVSEGAPTLVGLEFISRLQASEVSAIRALLSDTPPPLSATG